MKPLLILSALLALSACTANPLQPRLAPASEAASAATLVLSSKNTADKSTISVTAINGNAILQKSSLLLRPGHYTLTLGVLQAPDQSQQDGNIQPNWKRSSTTLQADLRPGMRYTPRSSIKGLMVSVSLEESALSK